MARADGSQCNFKRKAEYNNSVTINNFPMRLNLKRAAHMPQITRFMRRGLAAPAAVLNLIYS